MLMLMALFDRFKYTGKMAKRKAEELGGEDVKGDKQSDKKAKTREFWVVNIQKCSITANKTGLEEFEIKAFNLNNKLYPSKSEALLAAIGYQVDNVIPKKRRELGVPDTWEEGSFQDFIKYLDALNKHLRNDDNDYDIEWESAEVQQLTEWI